MATFTEAYQGYLLSQQARNLSRSYMLLLTLTRDYWVSRIGNIELTEIGPSHIREFVIWLQGGKGDGSGVPTLRNQRGEDLSSATVDLHFRNLRSFFNWCLSDEMLQRSPMENVRKPRVDQKLPDALSDAEVEALLKGVKHSGDPNAFRDYCIHAFFVDTGVRLEELSTLTLDNINITEGYARVLGKGRKWRVVPLGLALRRDLSKYLRSYRKAAAGETALFINGSGMRLDRSGVRTLVVRDLKKYVARKLSKTGPHTLRHTSATCRLRATRDIEKTRIILGHSDITTTQRYLHLVDADTKNDESPLDNILR